MPQATAFINLKHEIIHVSDQWLADFSVDTNNEMVGSNIIELFSNFDENWQKALDDCLKGEPYIKRTASYIDNSESEKWFEVLKITWHDENENVIGWIIQAEKFSQYAQTEFQLDKMHMLSAQMSDIAQIGLWEYHIKNDTLIWSEMTKIIHEVGPDYQPNIEESTNFYKTGYSRNTVAMTFERAIEDQSSWSEKLQLITAKGNEIWVIVSGKPLYKMGKFIGFIGTIQNIDALTQSEIKTKENEYLLRTLIDNLPLNVYIKNTESEKVLVNKSEMDFYGLENESDLIGKDDFAFMPKEEAELSRKEDFQVMHNLKPIFKKEYTHNLADNVKRVLMTSKIPLINSDGSAYGLVGIGMDITDLKKKEDNLKSLINVTSIQNKKLLNFAHIVSHNLRSHTANFSMLLEFLQNEKNESEKSKIMEMLTKASDNLLETINSLNEVVDITTKNDLEKVRLNLNKKIAVIQQNLAAKITKHNVQIVNTIDKKVNIKVIPSYIESILMNFFSNAIKYRSPDRALIIKLRVSYEKNYTVLSIEDNGLGIDLKKHGDKLFGMYKTFHENEDARGLGLYIAKNQIEAMNGKVTVKSKVGVGSIFKIYFNEED